MKCGHRIAGWPKVHCDAIATVSVTDSVGERTLFCRKHFLEALSFFLYDGPNETITVGPVVPDRNREGAPMDS